MCTCFDKMQATLPIQGFWQRGFRVGSDAAKVGTMGTNLFEMQHTWS